MADLLAAGRTWLNARMKASGSTSIVYTNEDAQVVYGIAATAGESTYRTTNQSGVEIQIKTFDWIIDANDLNFGAGRVDPEHHDIIAVSLNGRVCQFRVVPLGDDPCFRWADASGVRIRIHTTLIGES
jgi:hypothetical protein